MRLGDLRPAWFSAGDDGDLPDTEGASGDAPSVHSCETNPAPRTLQGWLGPHAGEYSVSVVLVSLTSRVPSGLMA